jgi:hypothetical protein
MLYVILSFKIFLSELGVVYIPLVPATQEAEKGKYFSQD